MTRSTQQVLHTYRFPGIRRDESGFERDIADVTTGNIQLGQLLYVQSFSRRCTGKDATPDFSPLRYIRERKLNDEANAAQEGCVENIFHVGCENSQALVGF